jgi:hypothetical protein
MIMKFTIVSEKYFAPLSSGFLFLLFWEWSVLKYIVPIFLLDAVAIEWSRIRHSWSVPVDVQIEQFITGRVRAGSGLKNQNRK